jgi:hypothetical protein
VSGASFSSIFIHGNWLSIILHKTQSSTGYTSTVHPSGSGVWPYWIPTIAS